MIRFSFLRKHMASHHIHAIRLERAAFLLLVLMPFAMAIANRSAAAIVVLAGTLALISRMIDGARFSDLFSFSYRTLAAALFIAWAALSISWSHAKFLSLFVLAEAGLPFIGGILLLLCLPREIPKWVILFAAIVFAASCFLIIAELYLGLATREILGTRAHSSIFNRPVMTLLLIYWPLAIQMHQSGWRLWPFALCILLIITIITATSGASMLGLSLALPAFLIALWSKKLGLTLASIMLAGSLALAPFKGAILERLMPHSLIQKLEPVHAADRIIIWQDFSSVFFARPLTGAGFGVSAKMAEAPFAEDLPPEHRQLLAVGHPHDGFLQIWAELGLIGALLAAFNGFFLLRAISNLPPIMAAAAVASTVAGTAVVSVFHGAWQGWWIGLLMATAVWCTRTRSLSQ